MCKKDLALNNLQWLIYHKTKQIKPTLSFFLSLISFLIFFLSFSFASIIFFPMKYKHDLALNNLYGLKFHKT